MFYLFGAPESTPADHSWLWEIESRIAEPPRHRARVDLEISGDVPGLPVAILDMSTLVIWHRRITIRERSLLFGGGSRGQSQRGAPADLEFRFFRG